MALWVDEWLLRGSLARLDASHARILVVIQRPIRSRAIATKALVVVYTKTSRQSPEPKRNEYCSSDLARRLGLFSWGITFFLPRWLGRAVFLLSRAGVYVTKPILVVSGRLNTQLSCQFLDRFHTQCRHEPHKVDVIFSCLKTLRFQLHLRRRETLFPCFQPRLGYTYEVTFKV